MQIPGGRVRRSGTQSGFTLIELVVVVAIVAILGGVATYQVTRSRRRVTLERALYELQARIEQAQSLAAVAGSRLGTTRSGVDRIVYDGSCTADANPQMWVRFNGNQVEVPARLAYDDATDIMTVFCEVFDIAVVTDTNGVFVAPAAPLTFGFAPSGRTFTALGPSAPIFVQVGSPADPKTYGLRILPSGVICPASTAAGPMCDEELGT